MRRENMNNADFYKAFISTAWSPIGTGVESFYILSRIVPAKTIISHIALPFAVTTVLSYPLYKTFASLNGIPKDLIASFNTLENMKSEGQNMSDEWDKFWKKCLIS